MRTMRRAILILGLLLMSSADVWSCDNFIKCWMKGMDSANKARNYDEAVQLFSKAISFGAPKDQNRQPAYRVLASAHVDRAGAYIKLRQYDKAIADYTAAMAIDPPKPPFVSTFIKRGEAYLLMGSYQEAIRDFDALLRFEPRNGFAFRYRAEAYFLLEQYEKAISDISEAIKGSWFPQAINMRGAIYVNYGRLNDGWNDFNLLVSKSPNTSVYYNNRGVASECLGNLEAALADYTKAIEIDPEDPLPYGNRARLRGKNAKSDEELALAKKDREMSEKLPKKERTYGARCLH